LTPACPRLAGHPLSIQGSLDEDWPDSLLSIAMKLDYDSLEGLRQSHPAWRLLRSDHAALVASFLHRAFVAPNKRILPESDLAEALEDELFALRQRLGEDAFPKRAIDYLDDWAQPQRAWLRKFYRDDSDEPHFDLMPATEKVIGWLGSLSGRKFVGTESRLLTLLELLRQISRGAEMDPAERIQELSRQKLEIENEIAQVERGRMPLLDATALRDRFQQFTQMSRELLTDFREVEQNFRKLDRQIRERIALWEGSKKDVLDDFLGRRDEITDSDQGRSFRAFWDFLMEQDRLGEFTALLERALDLPAITEMGPDVRTRRVHYDWMDAGGHTQRTVAQLSHQLRRFLDDRAQLENRRIMELLRGIEKKALALRDSPPDGNITEIAATATSINLSMDRPMYRETAKHVIAETDLKSGDEDLDISALYEQVVVDKSKLLDHIRQVLQDRPQATLQEICELRPLEHGLSELLAYLQLAAEPFEAVVDPEVSETVFWRSEDASGSPIIRAAKMPRLIFVR
jgi:hypothetical protein